MITIIGRPVTPCLACANGFFSECLTPLNESIPCGTVVKVTYTVDDERAGLRDKGGQIKTPDAITDVQSTGRKRAALLFPIEEGEMCEWAGLLNAGGGVNAIIGCVDNLATALHHGPDKNTLNNKRKNVHKICAFCHNYWHAQNDKYYGDRPVGTEPFIPLDGSEWKLPDMDTKATNEQLVAEMMQRSIRKSRRKEQV